MPHSDSCLGKWQMQAGRQARVPALNTNSHCSLALAVRTPFPLPIPSIFLVRLHLLLPFPMSRVPLPRATAGNLVLIEGLDALVSKTATVVGLHLDEEPHIFRPLRFQTRRYEGGGC